MLIQYSRQEHINSLQVTFSLYSKLERPRVLVQLMALSEDHQAPTQQQNGASRYKIGGINDIEEKIDAMYAFCQSACIREGDGGAGNN
jgi:hypothetical protein